MREKGEMDVPKLKNDTMRSRFKKENCNPFHLSWSPNSLDSRCQIKMRINAKPKGGNEVSSQALTCKILSSWSPKNRASAKLLHPEKEYPTGICQIGEHD